MFYNLIERGGALVALVTLLLSWFFFYYHTNLFLKSLYGGICTAGIVWISYVVIRMLIITARK